MARIVVSCALLASLIASTVGHGGLANYTVGDTWYRGYDPEQPAADQLGQPWMVQREWDSINPIFDYDDKGIACNNPGNAATSYIPIAAGDNITAIYWYWLHPTGPMAVWLADCGDSCADVDVNSLNWFKIWHAGLVDDGALGLASSTWYQKSFQRWDATPCEWPITIPASLKPGKYLIRHEIISIHVANKPQWYPECAHLNVTGNGDKAPSKEWYFKFPGAYKPDDPLVNIDIYSPEWSDPKIAATYIPPLGPVWDGT